jgi:hypothetical protein
LDTKYQFLKQAAGARISDCLTEALDDINRYNFTENWRQILTRIPGLTDSYGVIEMDGDGSNLQYKSGQDDEELIELANDDWEGDACLELAMTQLRIQAGIHLLDTGAIEEGLVRVLWLDEHGKCVWENTLDPVACDMDGLAGALMNYTSLVEITGYDGVKGALIKR